jgi:signal transduction histidine kinase
VFQPFIQAESAIARKFGGTGLGLAITRKVVELLGGALEASSVVGQGSTFALIVPAIVSEPSAAPEQRDDKKAAVAA